MQFTLVIVFKGQRTEHWKFTNLHDANRCYQRYLFDSERVHAVALRDSEDRVAVFWRN